MFEPVWNLPRGITTFAMVSAVSGLKRLNVLERLYSPR